MRERGPRMRMAVAALMLLALPSSWLAWRRYQAYEIASWVDTFHGRFSSFDARLKYVWRPTTEPPFTEYGQISVSAPSLFRIDYTHPLAAGVISDGDRVTYYEGRLGDEETYGTTHHATPRAFELLVGTARLGREFDYELASTGCGESPTVVALALTPTPPDTQYQHVTLCVSTAPSFRGLIVGMELQDRLGRIRSYRFDSDTVGECPWLGAAAFTFVPSPNALERAPDEVPVVP